MNDYLDGVGGCCYIYTFHNTCLDIHMGLFDLKKILKVTWEKQFNLRKSVTKKKLFSQKIKAVWNDKNPKNVKIFFFELVLKNMLSKYFKFCWSIDLNDRIIDSEHFLFK